MFGIKEKCVNKSCDESVCSGSEKGRLTTLHQIICMEMIAVTFKNGNVEVQCPCLQILGAGNTALQ